MIQLVSIVNTDCLLISTINQKQSLLLITFLLLVLALMPNEPKSSRDSKCRFFSCTCWFHSQRLGVFLQLILSHTQYLMVEVIWFLFSSATYSFEIIVVVGEQSPQSAQNRLAHRMLDRRHDRFVIPTARSCLGRATSCVRLLLGELVEIRPLCKKIE